MTHKLIEPTENGFLNNELEHYEAMQRMEIHQNESINRLNAAWLLVIGDSQLIYDCGLKLEPNHQKDLPPLQTTLSKGRLL